MTLEYRQSFGSINSQLTLLELVNLFFIIGQCLLCSITTEIINRFFCDTNQVVQSVYTEINTEQLISFYGT